MYNPIKAAQIISFFACKEDARTLDVVKAIKLVYLADRESVTRFGAPILDEQRVSMPHGPVNSQTYAHINGEHDLEKSGWANFLEDRANHQLAVKDNITYDDLDELSEADIQCLEAVWKRFGGMTKWEIRDWTHERENVPEWEDPHGSSVPIPLERMMSFVGVVDATSQAQMIEDQIEVDRLFARLA